MFIFTKFTKYILLHKAIAGILALIFVVGGYWYYQKFNSTNGEVRYLLAAAENGMLITSVSGSGQVSSSNQVDIKTSAGGDVIYVGFKNGDMIKNGSVILQLDARDAAKSVRDAETALENTKLSWEKFKISNAPEKLEADLQKAYDDGFNAVSNVFLDLPDIMTGLNDILFGTTLSNSQSNINYYSDSTKSYYDEKINAQATAYREDTYKTYQSARTAYDKAFMLYKSVSRTSDDATVENRMAETYEATLSAAESIKDTMNLIQFYKDELTRRNLKPVPLADTHMSSLNSYTSKTNAHILKLLSMKEAIADSKDALKNSEFDFKSQELAIKQKENALSDAKEKLEDYFVRAPFNGVIAQMDVERGDTLSANAVIGVLMAKQKVAEISLNEVDVAKVKIGQKATLTFDAVPDLNITGNVAEIDDIGTVAQGVVSYSVKIIFDVQDERVKPGMSVSATIITDTKVGALMVPNSAVKSQGGSYYVEIPDTNETAGQDIANLKSGMILTNVPKKQNVEIGLTNDDFVEIITGLQKESIVIIGTMNLSAASAAGNNRQQSTGLRILGVPGGGSGGGGGAR